MAKKSMKKYTMYIYTAVDNSKKIRDKITDSISFDFYDNKNSDLVIDAIIDAKSYLDAFEKVRSELDVIFDNYCAITGNDIVLHPTTEWNFSQVNNRPLNRSIGTGMIPYRDFQISKNEIKLLHKNIKKFSGSQYAYLRLAMKYYRKGKWSQIPEDKLINYFIALEALYSNSKSEISFRFAMRLALLLGHSSKSRKNIAQKAKKLYDIRSRIIHGDKFTLPAKSLKEADEWLRKSILSFMALSNNYGRDEILTKLDEAMVDNDLRSELYHRSKLSF